MVPIIPILIAGARVTLAAASAYGLASLVSDYVKLKRGQQPKPSARYARTKARRPAHA